MCTQKRQARKDVTLAPYLRPVAQSHVDHPGQGLSLFTERVTARGWGACVPTSPRTLTNHW